jgi:hypothetical protein
MYGALGVILDPMDDPPDFFLRHLALAGAAQPAVIVGAVQPTVMDWAETDQEDPTQPRGRRPVGADPAPPRDLRGYLEWLVDQVAAVEAWLDTTTKHLKRYETLLAERGATMTLRNRIEQITHHPFDVLNCFGFDSEIKAADDAGLLEKCRGFRATLATVRELVLNGIDAPAEATRHLGWARPALLEAFEPIRLSFVRLARSIDEVLAAPAPDGLEGDVRHFDFARRVAAEWADLFGLAEAVDDLVGEGFRELVNYTDRAQDGLQIAVIRGELAGLEVGLLTMSDGLSELARRLRDLLGTLAVSADDIEAHADGRFCDGKGEPAVALLSMGRLSGTVDQVEVVFTRVVELLLLDGWPATPKFLAG